MRPLRLEPLEQRQVLSAAPVSADWAIDAAFDESARVGRLDNTLTVTLDETTEGAKLDAWIDLNGDGSYGGSGGYGFNGGKGETHGSNVKDHAAAVDFIYQRGSWSGL